MALLLTSLVAPTLITAYDRLARSKKAQELGDEVLGFKESLPDVDLLKTEPQAALPFDPLFCIWVNFRRSLNVDCYPQLRQVFPSMLFTRDQYETRYRYLKDQNPELYEAPTPITPNTIRKRQSKEDQNQQTDQPSQKKQRQISFATGDLGPDHMTSHDEILPVGLDCYGSEASMLYPPTPQDIELTENSPESLIAAATANTVIAGLPETVPSWEDSVGNTALESYPLWEDGENLEGQISDLDNLLNIDWEWD